MRFSLMMSLRAVAVVGAVFIASSQVYADDGAQVGAAVEGEALSADTIQTSEKFGWGDLNPVHWGKSLEKDAEKLGKGIAKAGEKAWKVIKSLAEPCNACKAAVGLGIDAFTCGMPAGKLVKQISECSAKVSEEQPELVEETPVLCTAIKAAVEIACKQALKHNESFDSLRSSLIDHTCHEAHLCK